MMEDLTVKKIGAVISAVVLVLALSQVVLAENLLGDGGFETGGVWNIFGNVERNTWSHRSGDYGFAFFGWDASVSGGCWQDVALPALGTYTFSIYIRAESNFNPSTLELKLEGYALDHGTKTEPDTVANWISLPRDGLFHHIYVTKTYTNPSTAYIRPVIYGAWSGSSIGNEAVMIDDTELYAGSYTGVHEIVNPGFEIGQEAWGWRGGYWAAYPEDYWGVRSWANRSGTNGVVLEGWEPETAYATRRASQPLTLMSPGTYTFSVWMHREPDFALSNAALRLEFFDITLTNKVQADVVTNFVVPNDGFWRKYYVVGAVTSPALYEMRPVIEMTWKRTTNGVLRALRMDDVRFFAGSHDGYGVATDWGYHGAVGVDPQTETVPGTNVGTFLQVNYTTRTNTFYVLAKSPSLAVYTNLGDDGKVGIRTAYQRPEDGSWVESYTDGIKLGPVVIGAGAFRGQPASGSVTVDLWRVRVPHPTGTNGLFYTTNGVHVYYVPYFKATNAGVDTEVKFLVWQNGDRTNALGQAFCDEFWARDYGIDVFPPIVNDAFTNGGFENPIPATNNLNGTGWVGTGGASREMWAARTGSWGAFFPTWDPGAGSLYQDVLTAGGSVEFSFWIQVQSGANPTSLEARIQWYDSDGSLVQENRQDLLFVPKGNFWTKVCVLGNCSAPGLQRARFVIAGAWGDGTVPYDEAILIDDADVQEVRTSLENSGFETGPKWFPAPWYVQPGIQDIGGQEGWAKRSGLNGFALYGWNTNTYAGRIMQPIEVPGTGTYVFSVWLLREANMPLSNAALRLEWFSAGYSNKVQGDTVAPLTVPNNGAWGQYAITGTCNAADLLFVQASLEFAFGPGSTSLAFQAMMLDDAEFYATNVVVSETDGIPNWWLQQYGLGLTNGVGAGDDDGDGVNNWDEYAADTDPTDSNSWFRGVRGALPVGGLGLISTDSSSTGRYYFLEYKTNLLDAGPWLPYAGMVPGSPGGGPVVFTTTNDAPQRFYRIGVKP